jgi:hypothetical protein
LNGFLAFDRTLGKAVGDRGQRIDRPRGIVAMVVGDAGEISDPDIVSRQLLQLLERPVDLPGIQRRTNVGKPDLQIGGGRRRLHREGQEKNAQCHEPNSGDRHRAR